MYRQRISQISLKFQDLMSVHGIFLEDGFIEGLNNFPVSFFITPSCKS